MKAVFICHPDFADIEPINVFHKELADYDIPKHPPELQNRHILFRRSVEIADTENVWLKISADDYYKLYINGVFITQGPASGYPQAYYYNELDVSGYLKKGTNVFAIHTYYQGLVNRVWVSGDLREMLYFSLFRGKEELLVSDESWRCAYHTAFSECGKLGYDTAFSERYDSRAPEVGFEREDFDDSTWINAGIYRNADYSLILQPTKQLEIYELEPMKVVCEKNRIFVDFGREAVGYLIADAVGAEGTVVVLRFGEELNEDGSIRYELRCNCKYEEEWILSGGSDTLKQYDYKAFRYAELVWEGETEIKNIRMLIRHYPFKRRTEYKTENPALRQIIELCADTIKYGTQESFVDCPTREKGQYSGDVAIAGRAYAALTGDTAPLKKAIMSFCRSSFICPGLMAVSDSSFMQEIADYSLQIPALVCWSYSIDGDIKFLRSLESSIDGMFGYFRRFMNSDGLLEGMKEKWNLVDWPANLRDGYDFPLTKPIGEGIHNVLNAFWCGFIDSLDEYYSLIGKEKTGLSKKAKQAFISAFYDEKVGLFCDSATHTHSAFQSNVLPLLFDIGTEDAALERRMIDFIAAKKLTAGGVYMAYFALAALCRHGEYELAEELTLDSGCWLNMLAEGATTAFEAWGKNQKWNTSLFHPWASAPAIVFADEVRPY